MALLGPADLPVAPVNTMREAFEDPQLKHREMLLEMDHPVEGRIPLHGQARCGKGTHDEAGFQGHRGEDPRHVDGEFAPLDVGRVSSGEGLVEDRELQDVEQFAGRLAHAATQPGWRR